MSTSEALAGDALELATDDNFDEEGYLLANPDVRNFVRGGGNARKHFDSYGRGEGRHQRVPAAVPRAKRKYDRFRHLLDAKHGASGDFAFVAADGQFPITFGGSSNNIADYDYESAHPAFVPFTTEIEANPDKLYLDVGCGRRNYTHDNCLYIEVYPSVSADIILEPSCLYPIASNSIDGIGCFAVLEHVTEPWVAVEEFRRILKPGGMIYIDWPFLAPVHGYPSHYYNTTRHGLQRLFERDFEILELDSLPNQTPDHTVTWILGILTQALPPSPVRDELMGMTVRELVTHPPEDEFWQRVNAATPDETKMMIACGNTMIARKF